MTVTIMKKTKNWKIRVGIFQNMGGNIPGGNILGGNFPGRNLPSGRCPDTLKWLGRRGRGKTNDTT